MLGGAMKFPPARRRRLIRQWPKGRRRRWLKAPLRRGFEAVVRRGLVLRSWNKASCFRRNLTTTHCHQIGQFNGTVETIPRFELPHTLRGKSWPQ